MTKIIRITRLSLIGIFILTTLSLLAPRNTFADESVNHRPQFKHELRDNYTVEEGRELRIDISATDPDDDALNYSFRFQYPHVDKGWIETSWNGLDHFYYWRPDWRPGSSDVDRHNVTFTVSDGNPHDPRTLSVSQTTWITVLPNPKPMITSLQIERSGAPTFKWEGYDPSPPYPNLPVSHLSYSYKIDDYSWSALTKATSILVERATAIDPPLQEDTHTFYVKAIDEIGEESEPRSIEFDLPESLFPNHPPEMDPYSFRVMENNSYAYWYAWDPDDRPYHPNERKYTELEYSDLSHFWYMIDNNDNNWKNYSCSGWDEYLKSWKIPLQQIADEVKGLTRGLHTITVKAVDKKGVESDSISRPFNLPDPILPNSPPYFYPPIGDRRVRPDIDETLIINLENSAKDPNFDNLTYGTEGQLPAGAWFNHISHTFTWRPVKAQIRDEPYSVTFTVTDNRSPLVPGTIKITVAENQAPEFNTINVPEFEVGIGKSFGVSATDPDGDTLTYSAFLVRGNQELSLSEIGASFSGQTFSWTPNVSQVGTHQVRFKVTDGIIAVPVSQTITITVKNVVQNYTLTITAVNGSVSKSPDKANYNYGEEVTLTATANTGYRFSSWSGDLSGSTSPATITMNSNKTVTANFVLNTYTIIASAGTGGSISPSGNVRVNYGADQEFTIAANSGYNINQVLVDGSPVTLTEGNKYTFKNVTANHTIVAGFTANPYTLTITAVNGSVSKNPNQTSYNYGTQVTLTAIANTGYSFTGWSGDLTGSTNPATITMNSNKTVTANFSINPTYTLTINATNGSVTKSPDKANYNYGEEVTLTATADTGYTFSNWSGDLAGSANPTTITMDGNKSVTANFATITVEPGNRPPYFNTINVPEFEVGIQKSFGVSATDPDADTLTYSAFLVRGNQELPLSEIGARFSSQTFTWTPNASQVGTHQVRFKVRDGKIAVAVSQDVTISVKAATNRAPYFYPHIGNKNVEENEPLTFTVSAKDDDPGDTENLTYSATGIPLDNKWASFTPGTRTFNWQTTYAQAGSYNVTFKVDDHKGGIGEETITITVGNVNRPPGFDRTKTNAHYSGNVGGMVHFSIYPYDPDLDPSRYSTLQCSGTGTPLDNGWARLNGQTFSWWPKSGQEGKYSVTFIVSDGKLQDSMTVEITIGTPSVNHAPVLEHIDQQSVANGQPLSFTISADDQDVGDVLTYRAEGKPLADKWATLVGRDFSCTPQNVQVGDYSVTFIASDGKLQDSKTVTITVTNATQSNNHTPELADIDNQTVEVDSQPLTFIVSATDADDPSGLSLTYKAEGLEVLGKAKFTPTTDNPTTRTFSWTPTEAQVKRDPYYVTFTVSDGKAQDSEMIGITVIGKTQPGNHKPVLDPIEEYQTVGEGETLPLTISATDTDGDTLTYSVKGLPSNAKLDPDTGEFSWTPIDGQSGVYNKVKFSASDGQLTSDPQYIKIEVKDTLVSPNNPPVLNHIEDKTVGEGETLAFTISATDHDDDVLTYSATWATFKGQTFTWTPTEAQVRPTPYSVTFTVSDGKAEDSETISITVTGENPPVNHKPVLDDIGNKTVGEGETLAFTISATDDDHDVLTYSLTGLPANAELDPDSGDFEWTPTDSQAGVYNRVGFSASDGQETDVEYITIEVKDTLVSPNNPPVLHHIEDKTVGEGETLAFTISATDHDDDVLTYSATGLRTGANLDSTSGDFEWTPTDTQAGVYRTGFSVSDGKLTDGQWMVITVENASNPAPAPNPNPSPSPSPSP